MDNQALYIGTISITIEIEMSVISYIVIILTADA